MTVAAPAPTRAPRLRLRVAMAAVAGALLALAFPPQNLLGGWAAVPAFALLVHAHRHLAASRGALVGLTAGAAFFLLLLSWIRVLGPDAWIVLSLVCAGFWAGAGAVLPWLLARRGWVLTVPLLWVVMEALRERVPFGGFPWGRLAYSQADTVLSGWAAVGGPALASLAVALGGTLVLVALGALRIGRTDVVAIAVASAIGLALAGAAARGAGWGGPDGAEQPIALVQGNVPRLGLDFNAQRRAVLDNHVRETMDLAARVAAGELPQPTAVVWPENSSDIDPIRNSDAAAQINAAAESIGAPILVGGVVVNPEDPPADGHPGTVLNVALVWDPETGPGDRYVKRHPVPFGEYLPFRDLLTRYITRFERVPRDFAPGDDPGNLIVGPVPVGVVICFEIAYDELVRDVVRGGAGTVVVQTNNATYGQTGQPEQQLAISRVQAITSGRTTLVAATSGISAVIEPDGTLAWVTEEFTADATVATVPMRFGLTPAVRVGALPEVIALVALIALVLVSRRRGPRSR